MAFELGSTNLVAELGIIMAILLGCRFTLAEFLDAPLMVAIMAVLFRMFLKPAIAHGFWIHDVVRLRVKLDNDSIVPSLGYS
jgi:hypothetical protein